MSLDIESPTVWEETLGTWAWLSIVWNERREERRALRDAISPSRVARRERQEAARRAERSAARAAKRDASALTESQRRSVMHRARRGMSAVEIARHFGVPVAAVRATIAEGARR